MKIKKFEFNMFPVNCYVLSDEKRKPSLLMPVAFMKKKSKP